MAVNPLNCHDVEAAESFSLASKAHMKHPSFSTHKWHYGKVTPDHEVRSVCRKAECLEVPCTAGMSSSRRDPKGTAEATCGATSCFQIALSFVYKCLGVCMCVCKHTSLSVVLEGSIEALVSGYGE